MIPYLEEVRSGALLTTTCMLITCKGGNFHYIVEIAKTCLSFDRQKIVFRRGLHLKRIQNNLAIDPICIKKDVKSMIHHQKILGPVAGLLFKPNICSNNPCRRRFYSNHWLSSPCNHNTFGILDTLFTGEGVEIPTF